MTEKETEGLSYILFPVVGFFLFSFCLVFANSILPEHCSLFSNNIESGFACDGLTIGKLTPCAICKDKGLALVATIIAGFGIFSCLTPFLVFFIKKRRNSPIEQTKLFD